MGSRLRFEIAPIEPLCSNAIDELFGLYEQCYDGADRTRFEGDLREKHWLVLLRDASSSRLAGFSTQMTFDATVDGQPLRALFSGDTVIQPYYWGSQELVRAWCRLAGRLKAETQDRPLYWFLISKGHRTYLYLPLFFEKFYPRFDQSNPPFVDRLIAALGAKKYPAEFDATTGLIEHRRCHDRLKPSLDAAAIHLRNPHVDFFLRKNPRYGSGTELVCVAEISPANMRGAAKREMEAGLRGATPGPAEK